MNIKQRLVIVSTLLAFAFSCTGMMVHADPDKPADSPRFERGFRPGGPIFQRRDAISELGLSEEQVEQWREILQRDNQSVDELRMLQQSLQQLSASGDYSDASAEQLSKQIGETTARMVAERSRKANAFYQSLDEEQKIKFSELVEARKGKWEGERGQKQRGQKRIRRLMR